MNVNELNNKLDFLILKIKKKNQPLLYSKKATKKHFDLSPKVGKIYEIEKIIKKKNTKNGMKYFVKWKGFNNKHNSWINNDNFI